MKNIWDNVEEVKRTGNLSDTTRMRNNEVLLHRLHHQSKVDRCTHILVNMPA